MERKGGIFIGYVPDEKILSALLEFPTVEAAAAFCGIGKTTIYRRMQEPAFKEEYTQRRLQLVEAACGALQGRIGEAVEVLAEIMHDKKAGKMARVRAALAVLEIGIKTVETMDILPRIEALEAATNIDSRGG